MRLKKVKHGHSVPQKMKLGLIRMFSGFTAPDVVRTLMYRPGFFGRYMKPLTHTLMRGPSEWTVGERELFAAFVSRVNQCPF
jgi:hypothetical protein